MEKRGSLIRRQIFYEELIALKEEKYIDEDDFIKIENAYTLYLQNLEAKHKTVVPKQIIDKKISKPPKTKTSLTPEKIRERNISWSLILGVILLFIGGLVFGTSNWYLMNNLFKVLFVSLVSVIFFGSSYIAEKYLHIPKTAFAFMTLGSLFLPITFISIGYFELFGTWLSVNGGGKYLLGFIGSIVCFPLYTYIAAKYRHRLFIWFTYLAATICVSFLLAMTYLPQDFFYLGIMLYNALLLLGYFQLKNNEKFLLFTKELPLYTQLNLILSTLLMLFFYENKAFYSFNILLTAALYISMVFVNKVKHYHYIFTLLFVYGIYQLIENSFLQSINYIGFASIGILYLVFQKYTDKEEYIQKVFQLTSGIISFFAFLFISVQAFFIRSDGDSIVLFLAYLMIAVNYIYLAHITKPQIFRYLAPIFLLAAAFQSYYIVFNSQTTGNYIQLYMFTMAVIMYVVLYLKNHFKYFTAIKTSSFFVSVATMLLSIFSAYTIGEYPQTSILLSAFGFIAILTYQYPINEKWKLITAWVNPVSWGLALITFYGYIVKHIAFFRSNMSISCYLAICGLLLLVISYYWKSRKQLNFDVNTFITAIAVYTISILLSPLELYEHPGITSIIYFAGTIVYVLQVYKIKRHAFWNFVSITSLAFLASLIVTFKMENNHTLFAVYTLMIPIMLLLVYEFIGRKIQVLQPYFFWTAQVCLPFAFLLSGVFILLEKVNPVILIIPLAAYIYSTLKRRYEWEIKLFLYAALTSLLIIVYLTIIYYKLDNMMTSEYLFLIVSSLIAGLWFSVSEVWKKRIDWYLIPQSLLGLILFNNFVSGQNMIQFVLFLLYSICTLYLLHRRNWRITAIFPLIAVVAFLNSYLFYCEKYIQIGLVLVVFFAHHLFGKFVYKQLVNAAAMQIDWYTILSWTYIIKLVGAISSQDPLWLKLLPSLLVVYSLYTLINRFSTILAKKIVKTITAISILFPYYITLQEFVISQYIVTELYTLPFILLTIFLSRHTWKDYKNEMNRVQWFVLLIVTSILVTDALKSNTIYDAIIIGVLSLVSILGGMHYRIKSYFFVGVCVLLLNVFLQTRPYWGHFPWWGYLIIAGLTLIGFASYYELQRQRKSTGNKSFFQTRKEKVIQRFKDWD